MSNHTSTVRVAIVLGAVIALATITFTVAQDRLREMPGYEQYTKMQPLLSGAVVSGALNVTWTNDGKSFTYNHGGKAYQFDLATMQPTVTGDAPAPTAGAGRGGRGGGGVERGRQVASAVSRDGKLKVFYRERNVWLSAADGSNEMAITTDGSEKYRIKYGTASWVYGEELGQTSAMWWSPDAKKIAFYRFDESKVLDFFLELKQTALYSDVDTEAYPKPGTPNPIADIFVYDVATKKTIQLDLRMGKHFDDSVIGHYTYGVSWTADSSELLCNRTNRRQNIMEFTACNPDTGKCRVVVHEEWPTGWTDNSPSMRYLKDNRRFIWQSERNGWSNYYLYDLSGKLLATLTNHTTFEAGSIVKIDETAGVMFYMARDGDNHLKMQLHRVGLDGKGDVRLTDPELTHTVGNCMPGAGGGRGGGAPGAGGPGGGCGISPDNKFIVDVYQTHDQPAATQLLDASGKSLTQLAIADTTKFEQLGLKKVEMFTYKAADGKTTLYGTIAFPSTFDSAKKYPTLVPVYGGPASASNVPSENFTMPSATTEYGFLVVNLSSRAAPGMGKRALDSIYLKLGQTEMDDMAEGIKALWNRPYFDKGRVGIYGTSYGGYTAAMEIMRHPEVFTAAAASSPPTDWRNYDTIYTERYMWIPQENQEGYDAGNVINYAKNLRGRLLLYYGTADNNVHPNNTMQLIKALQPPRRGGGAGGRGGEPGAAPEGKNFEVQVGPDEGHSGVNPQRMMEFFIENLIMRPERLMAPQK